MNKLTFPRLNVRFVAVLALLAALLCCGIGVQIANAVLDRHTVVVACSDFQGSTDETSARNVNSIISAMKDEGLTEPDGLVFSGDFNHDMVTADKSNTSISVFKQTIQAAYPSIGDNMVLSAGNHEKEMADGINVSQYGANDTADYGVFVIHEDNFPWGDDTSDPDAKGTVKQTATDLMGYLNQKIATGYTKPIFVLCHVPLHVNSRSYNYEGKYSEYLVNVLNQGSAAGLNIVFLYGHCHDGGSEAFHGGSAVYYAPGDAINIKTLDGGNDTVAIGFHYMNAGYTGYYGTGTSLDLTMTSFDFTGSQMTITRYNSEGVTNLKNAGSGENPNGMTLSNVYASPRTVTLNQTVDTTKRITKVDSADIAVTSVSMDYERVVLEPSEDVQLSASVQPLVATDKTLSWTSSDSSVATVDAAGKVTAVNPGEATISAYAVSGVKAECAIKVLSASEIVRVTGVSLDKTSLALFDGDERTLTATLAPENPTKNRVVWSSSDESVATVDASGTVTCVGVGQATITVTTVDGGFTATCVVTVSPTAVTGISLEVTELEVAKGKTATLAATLQPTGATNKNVSWSTSNSAIATVSDDGTVTGVADGSATITATTEDGGFTATCTVTVRTEGLYLSPLDLVVPKGQTYQFLVEPWPKDLSFGTIKYACYYGGTIDSTGLFAATVAGAETSIHISESTWKYNCKTTSLKVVAASDVTWAIVDGVLEINSDVPSYTNASSAPWAAYAGKVTSIVIGEGVETVGAYAFSSCASAATIEVPAGTTLDDLALDGLSNIVVKRQGTTDDDPTTAAPDAPQEVGVFDSASSSRQLVVSWTIGDGSVSGYGEIDHFNIYRDGELVAQLHQSACIEADGSFYWEATLPVEHAWQYYSFEVTAVSVDGVESEKSASDSSSASSDDNAVSEWSVDATTEGISIEACTDLKGSVNVYRDDVLIGAIEDTSDVSSGTFVDTTATPGILYVYRLEAVNQYGETGTETVTFSLIAPNSDDDAFVASSRWYDASLYEGTVTLEFLLDEGETVLVCRNGVVMQTYSGKDLGPDGELVTFEDTPTGYGSYRYYIVTSDGSGYAGQSVSYYYDKQENRAITGDVSTSLPSAPQVRYQLTDDGYVVLEWTATSTATATADAYYLYFERTDGVEVESLTPNSFGAYDYVDGDTCRYVFIPEWGVNDDGDPIEYRFSVSAYVAGVGKGAASEAVVLASTEEGEAPAFVVDEAPDMPVLNAEFRNADDDNPTDYLVVTWGLSVTGGPVEYYELTVDYPSDYEAEPIPFFVSEEAVWVVALDEGFGAYSVTLTACNAEGEASNVILFDYEAVPLLSVAQTATGAAELTWTQPEDGADVLTYTVLRKSPYSTMEAIATVDGTEWSYVDENVEEGWTYSYQVVARTASDYRYSTTQDFSFDGRYVECSAPTLLAESTSEGIVLSWTQPEDGKAERFVIEYCDTTAGETWASPHWISLPGGSQSQMYLFSDEGALGHTLEFRVTGSNSYGAGQASNIVSKRMPSALSTPESVPANSALLVEAADDGSVVFTWNVADLSQPKPTYFHVLKWAGDSEDSDDIIIAATAGQWVDRDVAPGVEYVYLIIAGNSAGENDDYTSENIYYVTPTSGGSVSQVAASVSNLILENIPVAVEVTITDKATVEEIEGIYNSLTPAQRAAVSVEATTRLRDAHTVLARLAPSEGDRLAATRVEEMVAQLPEVEALTVDDTDAVAGALLAYNMLSEAQKTLVSDESAAKLEAAAAMSKKVQLDSIYNLLKPEDYGGGTTPGPSDPCAEGHAWDTGTVTTEPTCTTAGVRTYTCANDATHTYTEAVEALGHDWGEWASSGDATCTADGTKTRTCARCHVPETAADAGSAKGHAWDAGTVTTEPTCTVAGVRTYTCANDHTHTYTEAVPALGHDVVTDAAVAATCTKDGLTEGSHCGRCKETLVAQTAVAALGHAEVADPAVGATCTAAGKTAGKHCSRCKEVLVAQEAVEALGHDWGEWASSGDATCTDDGTKTRTCARCHVPETAADAGSAKGHAWDAGTVTVEPDCTSGGTRTYTCTNDHTHTYTEAVPALGHDVVTDAAVAATCTKTGLTEGSHCSRCNQVITSQSKTDALGHTEVADPAIEATCTEPGKTAGAHCKTCGKILVAQREVAALGHKRVTDKAVAATCTKDGLTEGSHCERCKEVLVAQATVPALGHDVVTDAAIEATCTASGLTEGKRCSHCKEVLVAQETVPALGHDIVADAAVAATCTKTGLTEGSHCPRCNDATVTQQVVAMTSHVAGESVRENVVEAQIGKEGSYDEVTYCSVCGAKMSQIPRTIPALDPEPGPEPGGDEDEEPEEPTDPIEAFAYRLYKKILDRPGDPRVDDPQGYATQVNALRSGYQPAEIAYNYFNSAEYLGKNETPEQTVRRVYQVMFGRKADEGGLAMWVEYLECGMSIRAVVQGFSQSEEYHVYFKKIGVNDATISRTTLEARDRNVGVTQYVFRLYTIVLGRDADAVRADSDGLNVQTQAILNGVSAATIARNVFSSAEFVNRNLEPSDQVVCAYLAILGRTEAATEADVEGRAYWEKRLEKEDIVSVVNGFCQSNEFTNLCAGYGVRPR